MYSAYTQSTCHVDLLCGEELNAESRDDIGSITHVWL